MIAKSDAKKIAQGIEIKAERVTTQLKGNQPGWEARPWEERRRIAIDNLEEIIQMAKTLRDGLL
jgi:hypothetical protein